MKKTLALIAHDHCKDDMLAFARAHVATLRTFHIVATRTTGTLLNDALDLNVERMMSGPQGGDLQIGAMVAEGKITCVIFLRDVHHPQPHEPDITALLRVCDLHNIPLATNVSTANALVSGLLRPSSSHPGA